MGDDASRTLAVACMLLASRDNANDGSFNGDPEYIKRFAYLNSKPDFNHLLKHEFIEVLQDDSEVIAECNTEKSRAETEQSRAEAEIIVSKADPIPYAQIVEKYHDHLPMLAGVKVLTDTRKRLIKARWFEDEKRQTVEYWSKYFKFVATIPFLIGDNDRGWQADLDFLFTLKNFVKIIEGGYERRKND